jgi:hypothetical protein
MNAAAVRFAESVLHVNEDRRQAGIRKKRTSEKNVKP